jgi:hypothetical protein
LIQQLKLSEKKVIRNQKLFERGLKSGKVFDPENFEIEMLEMDLNSKTTEQRDLIVKILALTPSCIDLL